MSGRIRAIAVPKAGPNNIEGSITARAVGRNRAGGRPVFRARRWKNTAPRMYSAASADKRYTSAALKYLPRVRFPPMNSRKA